MITTASILGYAVRGTNDLSVDVPLAQWMQGWQGEAPEAAQNIGDGIGGTAGAVILWLAAVAACGVMRWRQEVGYLLILSGFRIAALGLKPIFDSPRPTEENVLILRGYASTGYPSGHSLTAAMIGVSVVLIVWNRTPSRAARSIALMIGVLTLVLVGWSRVWSGAHWPSDVLGGWLYGVGFALLAWAIATNRSGLPGTQ